MSVALALGLASWHSMMQKKKCCLLYFGVVSYLMIANLKSYPTAVSKFDLDAKHSVTDF